jgi:PqqD family protein of HPr-rel-A system
MTVDSVVWRVPPPGAVAWREWDGEAVLYDERTGATHRLGLAAAVVWRTIAEAKSGASHPSIATSLESADLADGETASELAKAIIEDLERLGLVEGK